MPPSKSGAYRHIAILFLIAVKQQMRFSYFHALKIGDMFFKIG